MSNQGQQQFTKPQIRQLTTSELDTIELQAEQMKALVESEGWKLLEQMFEAKKNALLYSAITAEGLTRYLTDNQGTITAEITKDTGQVIGEIKGQMDGLDFVGAAVQEVLNGPKNVLAMAKAGQVRLPINPKQEQKGGAHEQTDK